MAIITPHESRAGIATGNAGQAAPYRSASAFMTPGQLALPGGLNRLAHGMDRLGDAVFRMGIDRMKMRNATDLLADKVAYEDALRQFDSDYRQTHQGVSARDAEEVYAQFHKEQYDKLQKKWGGNPFLMEGVNRMVEGIRLPSMNRAVAYRDNEEEAYKKSVLEASRAQTFQIFADPSRSWQEKETALQAEENNLRMFAGQRPVMVDGKIEWRGGKDVTAHVMALRQSLFREHLDGLIASGNLGAASAFLGGGGKGMSGVFTGQLPPDVAEMAHAEAGAQGLDPGLVMAVIAQESGGRSDAVSPRGARGLMQLMPETAAELGVNADNPAQNVRGGVAYLGNMLNRYGGNVEHALMAYNWGPGNMDAWLRTGKGVNGQTMPAETRAYASGVLGRLEGGASSLISPAARHQYRQRIDAAMLRNELVAQRADKEATERAADAAYAGIWESVRGLPAEEQQARAAAMIGEIRNLDMRRAMLGRLKVDLAVQKLHQDAADMTGIMEAEKATQNMLPSQRVAWLDQNWKGSRAGYDKAVLELTRPPKTETPENAERLGALRIQVDLGKLKTAEEVMAEAFANGLTTRQTNELVDYCKKGGQAGMVKDLDVKRIWDVLNRKPGGKAPVMPADLPELVRRELLSDSPGKTPTDAALRKAIARLALTGESRIPDRIFWGFGKDESLADAMRNKREGVWLSDADVPVYNNLRETGMDVRIRDLLERHGIVATAEKIVQFSRDKEAMRKYGLAE